MSDTGITVIMAWDESTLRPVVEIRCIDDDPEANIEIRIGGRDECNTLSQALMRAGIMAEEFANETRGLSEDQVMVKIMEWRSRAQAGSN